MRILLPVAKMSSHASCLNPTFGASHSPCPCTGSTIEIDSPCASVSDSPGTALPSAESPCVGSTIEIDSPCANVSDSPGTASPFAESPCVGPSLEIDSSSGDSSIVCNLPTGGGSLPTCLFERSAFVGLALGLAVGLAVGLALGVAFAFALASFVLAFACALEEELNRCELSTGSFMAWTLALALGLDALVPWLLALVLGLDAASSAAEEEGDSCELSAS